MNKTIDYEGQIEVNIPDDKVEEMLYGFKRCFGISMDLDDLLEHIAYSTVVLNEESRIEGVGDHYTIISNDQPCFDVKD